MNKADCELFESCKQLILLADLAPSDPEQALELALELPVSPATKELRAAVLGFAAGYRKLKKDFEEIGVPWSNVKKVAS
jgi:hypothetical protein